MRYPAGAHGHHDEIPHHRHPKQPHRLLAMAEGKGRWLAAALGGHCPSRSSRGEGMPGLRNALPTLFTSRYELVYF